MSALPQEDFTQAYTEPAAFASACLDLDLYDWQARAIQPLKRARGPQARLQNIAVCAPNGSGKDDRIIPAAAYWWLWRHKRGKVAITSKSALQLESQTIPSLDKHWHKFGWKEPVRSPRYTLKTPTGGVLTAFVSNSAERVEGWHKDDNCDGPLLQILNEAKSYDADMFSGLDRWTVNARLWISSPGLMLGRFFECFTKNREHWICIQAGLSDCPHIGQDRINFILGEYKDANSPFVRSTLHGEFMEQDETTRFCVPLRELIACLESPPRYMPGMRYMFFDFSDGGRAENVAVLREGNRYTIADKWRETNRDAVIGRSISNIRKAHMKEGEVAGDAAAKEIIDGINQGLGWCIGRQNFGAPDKSGVYQSWGAKAWIESGNKVGRREVILPDNEIMKGQATSRMKMFTNSGKLAIEDKLAMAKRGLASPDIWDAVAGAMAAVDMEAMNPKAPFRMSDWREQLENEPKYSVLDSIGAGY